MYELAMSSIKCKVMERLPAVDYDSLHFVRGNS